MTEPVPGGRTTRYSIPRCELREATAAPPAMPGRMDRSTVPRKSSSREGISTARISSEGYRARSGGKGDGRISRSSAVEDEIGESDRARQEPGEQKDGEERALHRRADPLSESRQYRTARLHLVFCGGRGVRESGRGREARLARAGENELTLMDLPELAARRSPRRVAVITSSTKHTYEDLLAGTRRTACGLRRLGLARGDRIAILLPNCIEYLHAFYAIPTAGGVTVPVNSFLAPAEVATVLEDSGARCLITTARRLAPLADLVEMIPT